MGSTPMPQAEFRSVPHSGGTVTISVRADSSGRRIYQLRWEHCRANMAAIFGVYALPQGIPVEQMSLGGIGSVPTPPTVPGCYQVLIGSDGEGKFGRQCPECGGYWRSELDAQFCPYCGFRGRIIDFLTIEQRAYIQQFCAKMTEAMGAEVGSDHVIDLDAVADAVDAAIDERPAFYYAELSQQNRYTCKACGGFNDILGTFGFCTECGTRNNVQELTDKALRSLRERINSGGQYEACVRDSVSAFDSFVSDYVKHLIRIPMTPSRRKRLENRRFHNLQSVAADLQEIFDIDLFRGLEPGEVEFAKRIFHRRHVYEHAGGEVDQKYIDDSGDTSVKLKQALRETVQSAHEAVRIVQRMATNLHEGFHEIMRVDEKRVKRYEDRQGPRTRGITAPSQQKDAT